MTSSRRDPRPGKEPVQTSEPAATAATLVSHAISLWIPATWGTIAFVLLRRSKDEPLTLRPSREERGPLWPPEPPWQRISRYGEEHAAQAEHQTLRVE